MKTEKERRIHRIAYNREYYAKRRKAERDRKRAAQLKMIDDYAEKQRNASNSFRR